jgi:hypothetical protein
MEELSVAYPDTDDFIASTAVARLNGYAGGYGTAEALQEDLNSFGLSPEGNKKLLEIADRGLSPACTIPRITSSQSNDIYSSESSARCGGNQRDCIKRSMYL